jgi:hypothetical protein
MVEMAILGTVVSVQMEMNSTNGGCLSLGTKMGRRLVIYPAGCFVPDASVSRLYVVPDISSMLFLYLFTTSSPLPLLILHLNLMV